MTAPVCEEVHQCVIVEDKEEIGAHAGGTLCRTEKETRDQSLSDGSDRGEGSACCVINS